MSNQSAKQESRETVSVDAAPAADLAAAPAAGEAAGPGIKSLSNYESALQGLLGSVQKTSKGEAEQFLAALGQASQLDGVVPARKASVFLESLIRRVDEVMTDQLNQVMHAEPFLKLEGTWRGLQSLVKDTDTNATLWVEMLNATKDELRQDFADAQDYKLSRFWDLAYTSRYDQSGGTPFGAFVSGFEFANLPSDLDLMKRFSEVGGATQSMFILSAAPELLGLRSYTELKNVNDLKNVFSTPDYTELNSARKNPDFRFITLTMPRVLARLPYGSKTLPADGLNYEEAPMDNRGRLEQMPHSHFCWSPSSYRFGSVLTKAFRQTNWCTAIIGEERTNLNGGTVGDLPLYTYYNAGGNPEVYPPTETVIPGDKEFALSQAGLVPLSYQLRSDKAHFMGGKTAFAPQGAPGSANFMNDFVASMIANVLPASRISHYMKTIGRKFHGRFASADQLKTFIGRWLANFKGDPSMDEVGKTKFPLQNYTVDVKPGWAPGVYDISLSLRFWTMIYQINTDVKMVAEVETQRPGK